jgi:hypothetical protein
MTDETMTENASDDFDGPRFEVGRDYALTVDGLEMAMILAALEVTAQDALAAVFSGAMEGIGYVKPLLELIDKVRNTK